MIFVLVNNTKEICKDIGEKLKTLRVKNGYSSYENFAIEHDLSRMQYWRIEKGLTNITIRSLVKILNIHRVGVEDFFLRLQDDKANHKASRKGKKPAQKSGRKKRA